MKLEEITFQFCLKTTGQTEALFIPGDDVSTWIKEICRWDVAHDALSLLVVPHSITDRHPSGLLVISDQVSFHKLTHNAVPCQKINSRLYLPVEAVIHPQISEAEMKTLLSDKYIYVWRPGCGLIAFESDEVKTLSDFILPGTIKETQWDYAVPGLAANARLHSISLDQLPDLGALFKEEEKDIGSDSKAGKNIPKSPDESIVDDLKTMMLAPLSLAAYGLYGLTQLAPKKPYGSPTWINSVENWANNLLQSGIRPDQRKRNKEINRLLNLLKNDPEMGLRYAIPSGGDGSYRGRAVGSNSLFKNNLNFDFLKLGASGPADFWDIPHEMQAKLLEQYRELANREVQLGRYRRAAYIHAHLLADFRSAAQVLRTGRQWREAALLYKEKLHRPEEAAECLVEGGLWVEAIALYKDLKNYEKIGDLHVKLDQEIEANEAYRTAVNEYQSKQNHIEAARILEDKLFATGEAIAELESGWPKSSQAILCLENMFKLFSRHSMHEKAIQTIDNYLNVRHSSSGRITFVQFLTNTHEDYPDRSVRDHAERCSKILISRGLEDSEYSEKKELLGSLSRLVPADKLLQRDVTRYLQKFKTEKKLIAKKKGYSRNKSSLSLVRTIEFSSEVDWKTAICHKDMIYLAGYRDSKLILRRCFWDGTVDIFEMEWAVDPVITHHSPILMDMISSGSFNEIKLHPVGHSQDLSPFKFPPLKSVQNETVVGMLDPMTVGLTCSSFNGICWTLRFQNGELVAYGEDRKVNLLISQVIPVPPGIDLLMTEDIVSIPCIDRGNKLFLALGNTLITVDANGVYSEEFLRPITSMSASSIGTLVRIAVSFDRGGTVIWKNYEPNNRVSFSSDIDNPVTCFNIKNHLICAGNNTLEIYRTRDRELEIILNERLDSISSVNLKLTPIKILSSVQYHNEIGLLNQDGTIYIFRTN